MIPEPPAVAVGYCRQSVARPGDDRDGGSVSVEGQEQGIARLCRERGWRLAGIFTDVDVSGATRARAGLDAALDRIRAGGVQVLVVNDLSRLARDTGIFLDIEAVLKRHDVELVSVREGGQERWLRVILAAIAEGQRDRISRDITVAKRTAAARGRHAGYAPLGYLRSGPGELAVDEEHAPTVRRIFRELLEGRKPRAIAEGLNRDGVATPGRVRRERDPNARIGTDYWSSTTVAKMARCATYAGLSRVGANATSHLGRSLEPVEAEGTWAPLVDRDDWRAVQRLLGSRSLAVRTVGAWHPLAGRLTCAGCGRRLYYYGKPDDASRHGRKAAWRCSSKDRREKGHPDHACPAPVKSGSDRWVSGVVVAALGAVLSGRVTVEVARAAATQERDAAIPADRTAQIEREVADIAARRRRIAHAIEHGIGDLEELAGRDRELVGRLGELRAEADQVPAVPTTDELTEASTVLANLATVARNATPEGLAALCARLGVSASVDFAAKRATVTLAEPFRWLVAP